MRQEASSWMMMMMGHPEMKTLVMMMKSQEKIRWDYFRDSWSGGDWCWEHLDPTRSDTEGMCYSHEAKGSDSPHGTCGHKAISSHFVHRFENDPGRQYTLHDLLQPLCAKQSHVEWCQELTEVLDDAGVWSLQRVHSTSVQRSRLLHHRHHQSSKRKMERGERVKTTFDSLLLLETYP